MSRDRYRTDSAYRRQQLLRCLRIARSSGMSTRSLQIALATTRHARRSDATVASVIRLEHELVSRYLPLLDEAA